MALSDYLQKQILYRYDLDARQTFAALARKVGTSRDSVNRVIHEYESKGVIKGYITVVDIGKIGFMGCAVYARVDTTNARQIARLSKYLEGSEEIYWVAQLGGKFDILFAIQASSLLHFAEVLSTIQKRFPFVTNAQFAIRTRATQFQRSYLSERNTARIQGGFEIGDETHALSPREYAILKHLIKHPRATVEELSQRARVTRVTVNSILRRLQAKGIFQGCSALIDCRKLGRESHLVLITMKRFDQNSRALIRKFAAQEPSVIFCIECIGPWQTEFHCEVASQSELQDLLRRFRSAFPELVLGLEIIAGLDYYGKNKYSI